MADIDIRDRRVFAVGIDGLPRTLIDKYVSEGRLPGFKKIMDAGYDLHQMDASIPDVSSTSWTSFSTGVNPAEHGIYGFIDLKDDSYDLFFPNSTNVAAPTLWEIAAGETNGKGSTLAEKFKGRMDRPLRSVVMNIPQTFPATEMNGILSAGFVCPDLRRGTYPAAAFDYLSSIGYVSDVDSQKGATDRDGFISDVFSSLETRLKAYEHFARNEEWDVFIGVITETDRMHHFFFEAAYDESHPMHGVFMDFYTRLDKAVERLFDLFMESTGGEGLFMTMSDHGFTKLESEVYANLWLKEQGFLKTDPSREFFDQIDTGTRAFVMDPCRIYVNTKGKYPRGTVVENEKGAVLDEIEERLSTLASPDGRPVVREIHRNGSIYDGPLAGKGPDMVCLPHDGFDLKGALARDTVFGKGPFTGMHNSYDAHCVLPAALAPEEKLKIENLAHIMLGHVTGHGSQ